jgi:hypothetical protein
MKRSFHCLTEENATKPEDIKKWHIQQILRSNQKTQFVFDFVGCSFSGSSRMNPDLLDVVIAMNAYGLYRFVGLTSPMFDGLLRGAMGSLIMDRLIPTCDLELPTEMLHHVLRLRVDTDQFYGGFGFDYFCNLITDWQSTKNLLLAIFSNIGVIADLCLSYTE